MKLLPLLLLSLFLSATSCAHRPSDKRKVKRTILKMFELVDAGKSNELAEYIVYRGNDETRKWKDNYHYNTPEEKYQVQNLHQKIVDSYLPYEYEFVKFTSQKESEGEWLVWEMKFITADGPKKAYFAFLNVEGKYLLGDID